MSWPWPSRMSSLPTHWGFTVLALSAVLAVFIGMVHTVNLIFWLSLERLATVFAVRSVAALFSLLAALTIVVVVGRQPFVRPSRRRMALAAAVLVAAVVGTGIELGVVLALGSGKDRVIAGLTRFFLSWSPSGFGLRPPPFLFEWLGQIGVRHLVVAGLFAGLREAERHSLAASAAVHDERLRGVALQGQLAEARLHMLQAQIEPHFLFNSLANVRRLSRLDPASGAAMLADLTRYFEATLPRLRIDASTLGHEAELVRAFLAVHQIRMGDRLAVEFAIPAELVLTPLPPMMLLTLVENALKHALVPLPEGGCIRIEAGRQGGSIHLSVSDTGRGLVPGHGKGSGLANIRARLRSTYGSAAQLTLRLNEPRGVIASIVLPAQPI
jgi:signal transduction histidine kinase